MSMGDAVISALGPVLGTNENADSSDIVNVADTDGGSRREESRLLPLGGSIERFMVKYAERPSICILV